MNKGFKIIGITCTALTAGGAIFGIAMGTNKTFRDNVYDKMGIVSEQKYIESQTALENAEAQNIQKDALIDEYKHDYDLFNAYYNNAIEYGAVTFTYNGPIYELNISNENIVVKLSSYRPYSYTGSEIKSALTKITTDKLSSLVEGHSVSVMPGNPGTVIRQKTEQDISKLENINISFVSNVGTEVDLNSLEDETTYKVKGDLAQCSVEKNEDGSIKTLNYVIVFTNINE